MSSLMQRALGAQWHELPPALQIHYGDGLAIDRGRLDIEFPWFMRPLLLLLRLIGALVDRRGSAVETVVEKRMAGATQTWRRRLRYADGHTRSFDTVWCHEGGNRLVEFVNPLLGVRLLPRVVEGRLHYDSAGFVLRVGRRLLALPEWAALGHTFIVEQAIDARRFHMDFRLVHPLFGQLYRYSGEFEAGAAA